jgi:hypothetical protein
MVEDIMGMSEAAERLGVSPKRAYALAKAGLLPVTRRDGRVFVIRRAWERWLEQQAEEALAGVALSARRVAPEAGRSRES